MNERKLNQDVAKQHLSHEQISELLLDMRRGPEQGPDRAAEMEHIHACAECNAELTELREALTSFGAAARNWSEKQDSGELLLTPRLEQKRPWLSVTRLGWSLAAAVLLFVFIYVPVHRKYELEQSTALNSASDEILLEQIDAQVSRRVPAAMDPFVNVVQSVSENSSNTSQSTSQVTSQGPGKEINSTGQGVK
jgi:hypothetical protein